MTTARTDDVTPRLPGEEAVWMFIMLDMISFAIFFASFCWSQAENRDLFASSQHLLHQSLGLLNTFLLITASWSVASAVKRVRCGEPKSGLRRLILAIVLGAGFMVVKAIEYSNLIASGHFITTNLFFMYYYCITLIHFLHTVIGVGVMIVITVNTGKERYGLNTLRGMESGATYWHMVDLLWIFVFPLLYLL